MRTQTEAELAYLASVSVRENDLQRRLRAETEVLEDAIMASTPEAAQFICLLLQAIDARRVIEVGVFTGLTTLAMALALPKDGRIIACDIEAGKRYTDMGRKNWAQAGVGDKIDLRIAPAVQTLDRLIADGQAGTFDLVYIDADKPSYDAYYERALTLLRPRGLVAFDNTLWHGVMTDPSEDHPSAKAIGALNTKLHKDKRIALSMLPIDDGVTVACKLA